MANDESVLKEVDQALDEDRLMSRIQQHGPLLLGGAAAIVLFVAGSQFISAQQNKAAVQSAVAFNEAVEQLEASPEDGRRALATFADEAPSGYKVLADLRRAASLATGGERLAARDLYRSVYESDAAPKRLQQFARIRAALLSLEDGREEVMRDIGDMESDKTSFGFHARELVGVAALNANDFLTAKNIFDLAAVNLDAPQSIRRRAEEFSALAAAGEAGVPLNKSLSVDDLTKTLQSSPSEDGLDVPVGEDASATDQDASIEVPAVNSGTAAAEDEPPSEENGGESNPESDQ